MDVRLRCELRGAQPASLDEFLPERRILELPDRFRDV